MARRHGYGRTGGGTADDPPFLAAGLLPQGGGVTIRNRRMSSPPVVSPRRGPGAQFTDFCAFFSCALGVLAILAGAVLAIVGMMLGAPLRVALVPFAFSVGTGILLFGSGISIRALARRFERPSAELPPDQHS